MASSDPGNIGNCFTGPSVRDVPTSPGCYTPTPVLLSTVAGKEKVKMKAEISFHTAPKISVASLESTELPSAKSTGTKSVTKWGKSLCLLYCKPPTERQSSHGSDIAVIVSGLMILMREVKVKLLGTAVGFPETSGLEFGWHKPVLFVLMPWLSKGRILTSSCFAFQSQRIQDTAGDLLHKSELL